MQNKQFLTSLYNSGLQEYESINKSLKRVAKTFPVIGKMGKTGFVRIEVSQQEIDTAMKCAEPIFKDCEARIELLETVWLDQIKEALKEESKELYNRFVSQIRGGRGAILTRYVPEILDDLEWRAGEIEYKLSILKAIRAQFYGNVIAPSLCNKYRANRVIIKTELKDSHILFINGHHIRNLNTGDFLATYIEKAISHPNTFIDASPSVSSGISKFGLPKNIRRAIFTTNAKGQLRVNPSVKVKDLTNLDFLVDDIINDFNLFLNSKN